MNEGHFIVSQSLTENEKLKEHEIQIPLPINIAENILLPGMGFAVKRLLVLSKFSGKFTAWCVNENGELLECDYNVDPPKMIEINGKNTKVTRVYQQIYPFCGQVEYEKNYYLPSGHMIYCEKSKSKHVIHFNPMSSPQSFKFPMNRCEHLNENMKLLSKYLQS